MKEHIYTETEKEELIRKGMHPLALQAFEKLDLPFSMVGQCIGTATLSAGVHEKDGEYQGHDYCGATDLRIGDLDEDQVKDLLPKLANVGFAAYYRVDGKNHWVGPRHIHMVYPGVSLKHSLRSQIHSWLAGNNGLRSNAHYDFWNPNEEDQKLVRSLFLHNNPMND